MGINFDYKRPTDIAISTTEITEGPITIQGLKEINLFLANAGSQEIFFEILGSPSGVRTGTADATGLDITAAIVTRENKSIIVDNLVAGANKRIRIDSTYNWITIKAWTIANTSTLHYFIQNKSDSR